ncbi:hypothetical protein UO65_3252 [Actinokineospora spheciospongiae]|uniref:Uncharacterized protein n=1 Tax=Actinokineospora spheciospongiae TaxID=909613 RepID=W7J601_9PSEU|nr:hypothetical protein UO65_3252 [Actinokineospora spheciospongiae]
MQGGQRRRAHGVDGEAGAGEVEEVRHPVGDARDGGAGVGGGAELGALDAEERVLVVHHAREHADLGGVPLGEPGAGVAGVLQGFPGDLEELALLRVHQFRVAGGDVEQQRVEGVHVGQEAAPHEVGGPAGAGPVGRELGDAVAAGDQVGPERLQVVGQRVAARDADDGDVAGGGAAVPGPVALGAGAGLGVLVVVIGAVARRFQGARDAREVGVLEEQGARGVGELGPQQGVDLGDELGVEPVVLQRHPRVQAGDGDAGGLGVGALDELDGVLAGLAGQRPDHLAHLGFGFGLRFDDRGQPVVEPVRFDGERVGGQGDPRRRRQPVPVPLDVVALDPAGQGVVLVGGFHPGGGQGGVDLGGDHALDGAAREVPAQGGEQLRDVGDGQREPVRQVRAAGLQGVGDLGEDRGGAGGVPVGEEVVEVAGGGLERGGGGRRQQHRVAAGADRAGLRGARFGAAQQHVAVGAGGADGVDHGPDAAVGGGGAQRLRGVDQGQRQVVPGDEGGALLGGQGGGDLVVFELQQHLDELRQAGGRLKVADVGFDRAHRDRFQGVGEHRAERFEFGGVGDAGPGGGALHVVDVGRVAARLGQGPGHGLGEGVGVGGAEAAGAAGVPDPGALDDAVHHVVLGGRGGGRAQHDHAAALAGRPTGGGVVVGVLLARHDQAQVVEQAQVVGVGEQVGRAHHRRVALAAADALHGQVQGGQRRRAGGVDGEAGAAEVEEVGDAVGDVGGGGGHRRRLPALPRLGADVAVVLPHGADEHPDPAGLAAQRVGGVPGVLQRLPHGLQQQAGLRVEGAGLVRGGVEQQGVEGVDAVEEAAGEAAVAAGGQRGAAGRGDRAGGALARAQVAPELAEVGGAGEGARHADDGDLAGVLPVAAAAVTRGFARVRRGGAEGAEGEPGAVVRGLVLGRAAQEAVQEHVPVVQGEVGGDAVVVDRADRAQADARGGLAEQEGLAEVAGFQGQVAEGFVLVEGFDARGLADQVDAEAGGVEEGAVVEEVV